MPKLKVDSVSIIALGTAGGAGNSDSEARVTQIIMEVLQQSSTTQTKITQAAIEVLQQPPQPQANITQMAVEVFYTMGAAYTDGGGDHILSYGY